MPNPYHAWVPPGNLPQRSMDPIGPSSPLRRSHLARLAWIGFLCLISAACSALSADQLARIHRTHWRLIAMEKELQPQGGHILLRISGQRQLFGQMNSSSYFGSYASDGKGAFRVLNLAPIQGGSSSPTAPEVIQYLSLILLVDAMRVDRFGQLVLQSEGRELLRFEDSLRMRGGLPDPVD